MNVEPKYIHMFEHFVRTYHELLTAGEDKTVAFDKAMADALKRFKSFLKEAK